MILQVWHVRLPSDQKEEHPTTPAWRQSQLGDIQEDTLTTLLAGKCSAISRGYSYVEHVRKSTFDLRHVSPNLTRGGRLMLSFSSTARDFLHLRSFLFSNFYFRLLKRNLDIKLFVKFVVFPQVVSIHTIYVYK